MAAIVKEMTMSDTFHLPYLLFIFNGLADKNSDDIKIKYLSLLFADIIIMH